MRYPVPLGNLPSISWYCMPTHQRQQARAQRHMRWLPCARNWHLGVLAGVLLVLLSLCHGVIAPAPASASAIALDAATASSVVNDDQGPFRDCAASKRLVALSERRGSAHTPLDVPAALLGFTEHTPDVARFLRAAPIPLPENHRAFLQVFRI